MDLASEGIYAEEPQGVNKELARRIIGYCSRTPILRGALVNLHNGLNQGHPWKRRHPFDAAYGIDTSTNLPWWLITSGKPSDAHTTGYAGCQPSCVREALRTIPELERRTFVDLGCGKGRALVLASEFPFRRIAGVEISREMAAQARRNAAAVQAKHPDRPRIDVAQGDAMLFPFPEGDLVVFLFHPFHRELVSVILARLEDAANRTSREIFVVYENPVYSDTIDAAPWLHRWYSKKVPYDADEVEYSLGNGEPVVIWRNEARGPGNGASPAGGDSLMN
jgi:SAM-dependent methyltransferase